MTTKAARQITQSSYMLQEADNGERLAFVSASTVAVFVPFGLSLGWSVELIQLGAGTVEIAPQPQVVVANRFDRLRSFGKFSKMTLEVISQSMLLLTGDVATSDITT